MYEMDKEKVGALIAALRKERGLTQKELAQELFVSDKAVSKWERGLAMPDVTLLIPLSESLGITVTELLEGRRLTAAEPMRVEQVEEIVKKAITLPDTRQSLSMSIGKRICIYFGGLALAIIEVLLLLYLGHTVEEFTTWVLGGQLMGIIFGAYFWLFVKERLPRFYDENPLNYYTHGIFRIHVPGVHFNNANWPYIVRTIRWYCVLMPCSLPPVYELACRLIPVEFFFGFLQIYLFIVLGGLFIPIYIAAKKYDHP